MNEFEINPSRRTAGKPSKNTADKKHGGQE
jgi:hypothetical protein